MLLQPPEQVAAAARSLLAAAPGAQQLREFVEAHCAPAGRYGSHMFSTSNLIELIVCNVGIEQCFTSAAIEGCCQRYSSLTATHPTVIWRPASRPTGSRTRQASSPACRQQRRQRRQQQRAQQQQTQEQQQQAVTQQRQAQALQRQAAAATQARNRAQRSFWHSLGRCTASGGCWHAR